MKAIFYDRRNKQEVSSDKLMPINLIEEYVTVDGDGCPDHTPYNPKKFDSLVTRKTLGELGYLDGRKQDHISYWNIWTNLNDLVFLRLEE